MSPKQTILNVVRLLLLASEALIVILSMQMFFSFIEIPLQFHQHVFIFTMIILTGFPLFFLNDSKSPRIWIGTTCLLWIVGGISFGIRPSLVWIPTLFGLWRSSAAVMHHSHVMIEESDRGDSIFQYLKSIKYRSSGSAVTVTGNLVQTILSRIILSGCLLGFYIIMSHLAQTTMWTGTKTMAWTMFTISILSMMAGWILDEWRDGDRIEWKRALKTQGLFLVIIAAGIAVFSIVMIELNWIYDSLVYVVNRMVYFITLPLIILFELLLPWLQSIVPDIFTPNIDSVGEQQFEEMEQIGDYQIPSILKWVVMFFFIGGIISIVLLLVFRYYKKTEIKISQSSLVEMKSASMMTEINEQSSGLLHSLMKWFATIEKDEVRRLYRKFLKQYQSMAKQEKITTYTARELMTEASQYANIEEVQILTKIYEDRRYGRRELNNRMLARMKQAVSSWYKGKS